MDQIVKIRSNIFIWIQKDKKYYFTIMQHGGCVLSDDEQRFIGALLDAINFYVKDN